MVKKNKFVKSISLRCDNRICNILEELEDETCLNISSILRVALMNLYKQKIQKSDNNDN